MWASVLKERTCQKFDNSSDRLRLQWIRKQLWIGGPKCIGRMTQNNINPVNNNAINKDKYTNVNYVSNLLRLIRRILKLRNPEKKPGFFWTYGPFAHTRSHIWPDYWGARSPLLHYWGGGALPPVPTPL